MLNLRACIGCNKTCKTLQRAAKRLHWKQNGIISRIYELPANKESSIISVVFKGSTGILNKYIGITTSIKTWWIPQKKMQELV